MGRVDNWSRITEEAPACQTFGPVIGLEFEDIAVEDDDEEGVGELARSVHLAEPVRLAICAENGKLVF